MTEPLRICVAGATGWAGAAITAAILDIPDLRLVGAVARSAAGRDIGTLLGRSAAGTAISASVEAALEQPADVLIDYTTPGSVKGHVLEALSRRVSVVARSGTNSSADVYYTISFK